MNKKATKSVSRLAIELVLAMALALFARSLSSAHAAEVDMTDVTSNEGLPALSAPAPQRETEHRDLGHPAGSPSCRLSALTPKSPEKR